MTVRVVTMGSYGGIDKHYLQALGPRHTRQPMSSSVLAWTSRVSPGHAACACREHPGPVALRSCQFYAPSSRIGHTTPSPPPLPKDSNQSPSVTRPSEVATTPQLQGTVRLAAHGIAKVLGDLEARVLEAMWALNEPASARVVHERIAVDHAVSPLTTITVLNKLVTKRVLTRRKRNDLYHYAPILSESAFRALVSRRVVEGILSFGPEAVASSLVDVLAEQNPEQLEELGRLIRRRLREQG